MADIERVVIIGGGLAGATAAAALRERGFTGRLSLFDRQPHRPYELPPLSKGVLLGDADDPDWVHEDGYYDEQHIELHSSAEIVDVRVDQRMVRTADGVEHGYDRLLLATGSAPRRLPVPGGDDERLHLLRTIDDARALRGKLSDGARVMVVGAGWIGCEVAAAARSHGALVTVSDPLPLPLRGVLGDPIAEVFRALHAEHGVRWKLGVGVTAFDDDGVLLADGQRLPADVIVVGVGAAPRLELAERAGLRLADDVPGRGVAVDATLHTSVPEIYAAGDIAAAEHPRYGRRIRVEHWANAKDQGAHVAGNILGAAEPFSASPYFFSDQYDLGMEYRGLADPAADELVIRGDLSQREFIAFWLRDGRVQAAMNVNSWDDGDALQSLVDNQTATTSAQLKSADLASIAH
ncbi:MAG: FAD-dependent oxidoreductase [Sciscionella sp.]|nr:FAD-dependent oxidoreductase [Sciscionella sp.]